MKIELHIFIAIIWAIIWAWVFFSIGWNCAIRWAMRVLDRLRREVFPRGNDPK